MTTISKRHWDYHRKFIEWEMTYKRCLKLVMEEKGYKSIDDVSTDVEWWRIMDEAKDRTQMIMEERENA